jgi:hypothetical protein
LIAMPFRLSVLAAMLALAGCNAWQDKTEFAAPQMRWSATQPSPRKADAKPPAIPAQYCYRTLATVDCFDEPVPERVSGYTGLYPDPASLPQAKPQAAAH